MKLAIIPARGGSKRIARKNIRPFAGRPVIAYSVEAALGSRCFDHVIVSTDDDGIADIPGLRRGSPLHAACGAVRRPHRAGRCDRACHRMVRRPRPAGPGSLLRICDRALRQRCGDTARRGCTRWRRIVCHRSHLVPLLPCNARSASCLTVRWTRCTRSTARPAPDLEPAWHDAGQFCWGTRDAFIQRLPAFAPHTAAIKLPRHLVQDLDTPEDWHRAELMYEALRRRGEL